MRHEASLPGKRGRPPRSRRKAERNPEPQESMNILPSTFWIAALLLVLALAANLVLPPLAVALGIAAGLLILWLLLGGR